TTSATDAHPRPPTPARSASSSPDNPWIYGYPAESRARHGCLMATAQRGHRGVALAGLCLAAFTINLDTTIVNIALPSLMVQLDASTRELQWVVDAYTLTFAALVLAAGSLGDRYGRKGALLTGLAVFGTATAVGGLVDSAGALIAVRAVMGVGAAL